MLGALGYAHGLTYCGDILGVLAVLGVFLLFVNRWPTRALVVLAGGLLLQLPLLWQLGLALQDPTASLAPPRFAAYYRELNEVFGAGGFSDVVRVNAVTGQLAKWWWTLEHGRLPQLLGLFLLGIVAGRARVFEDTESGARWAKRAVILGLGAFAAILIVESQLGASLPKGAALRLARRLADLYGDFAQMLVWAGGFVLLFQFTQVRRILCLLAPYGQMSLTCYVTQALFWVPLYYHFGLGLFRHWGQLYSVGGGILFFIAQLWFAHVWLRRFRYGPLEWLWRCGAQLRWTPLRRDPVMAA